MAQTNYTPISLYYSTTASAVPTAANLVQGELAINTADGKLYYEDSSGVVQVLATKSTGSIGGSNTQVQFNNNGSLGGSSGLTWDGSFLTTSSIKNSALTSGRVTYAGTAGLLQDDADFTFNGTTVTMANDASISGLTVGKGAGAVATNTAVGVTALAVNTTGNATTAIGYNALGANIASNSNTAVGFRSLEANVSGSDNTAIGRNSLSSTTSGSSNTGLGYFALYSNTTASNNTAVGYQAGYTNSTGTDNLYLGRVSGYNATTSSNTFVGADSGFSVTSGAKNTILGRYNGNQGGLDIRTSDNRIVLSDGDGNPRMYFDQYGFAYIRAVAQIASPSHQLSISHDGNNYYGVALWSTAAGGTQQISFFNSAGTQQGYISTNGTGTTSYVTSSDYRLKENIVPMTGALAKVAQLKPVTYKWKEDGSDGQGFIAHELAEIVPECVDGEKDAVHKDGKPKYQGVDTSFLVATLTAAIQELKAEFDAYKATHP